MMTGQAMFVALLVLPLPMLQHGNGNEEDEDFIVHWMTFVETVVRNVEPSISE